MDRLLCVLALTAVLPMGAAAQLTEKWGVPGSPTGQAVAAVLEMIDRGDAAYVRSAVGERFHPEFAASQPMEAHVAFFAALHDRFPEVEPVGLRRAPSSAVVGIRGASGESARLQVSVGDDGLIRGIRMEAMEPEGRAPDLPLEQRLEAWAQEGRLSGVVYRTRDGAPVWSAAYGQANRSDGVANTVDTRFNIGSLTKAFTGAAILLLWEEGRVGLDDPIGRYLDGFPADVAESVTIRHLLTHRSGWGHYWDHPTFRARLAELRTVGDYLSFIREIPLDFEPGSREQYSNVGYEVLGAIVEAVTGEGYYDFVQDRIFAPLGMTGSGFFQRDQPTPRRAVGYTLRHPYVESDAPAANTFLLAPRGTPAGGSYSTAADLARFWYAMLDYRLLGETASHMVMGDFEEGEGPPGGPNVYGGGAPGVAAQVVLVPDRRTIDVVLLNLDTDLTERISRLLESTAP